MGLEVRIYSTLFNYILISMCIILFMQFNMIVVRDSEFLYTVNIWQILRSC